MSLPCELMLGATWHQSGKQTITGRVCFGRQCISIVPLTKCLPAHSTGEGCVSPGFNLACTCGCHDCIIRDEVLSQL
jgi:hypothetical protein